MAAASSSSTPDVVELQPLGSTANHNNEQLFPPFYRRAPAPAPATTTSASLVAEPKRRQRHHEELRVLYQPIPEEDRLGYISTTALILGKIIGYGIFVQPPLVVAGTGGKGVSIGLWISCGLVSLLGVAVYVELGTARPFTGGELVYIADTYPRPQYLSIITVSFIFVLLSHWAPSCLRFAQLVLQAFDPETPEPNIHLQKFVALVMLTTVCVINMFSRRVGIVVNNILAVYKVTLLLFVVLIGFVAMGGGGRNLSDNGHERMYGLQNLGPKEFLNYKERDVHDYADAIVGVMWSYTGWENANYVLGEIRRGPEGNEGRVLGEIRRGPEGNEGRVLKMSAFVSMAVVITLYTLVNIAYFTVLSTEEMIEPGEMIVIKFFVKFFGRGYFCDRALKVLVSLSVLGNFLSATYTIVRVKQEIAKTRILPFSHFWARNSFYNTPCGALLLHWIVTAIGIIFAPGGTAALTLSVNIQTLLILVLATTLLPRPIGEQWQAGIMACRRRGQEPLLVVASIAADYQLSSHSYPPDYGLDEEGCRELRHGLSLVIGLAAGIQKGNAGLGWILLPEAEGVRAVYQVVRSVGFPFG